MTSYKNDLNECNVAILAGGRGTRLSVCSGNLPKPMVPVSGKPVIQHQIELCRENGFIDIALLVHYRHEAISDYFGDGSTLGVRLRYIVEAEARGTAGALLDALPLLAGRIILLYGDTYMDVNLRLFWNFHITSGASATLFLHPNDHPQDSDLVDLDATGYVRAIHPYPHPPEKNLRNLVNAALYVLEKDHLEKFIPPDKKSDIAKDLFPALLTAGMHLRGYVSPEYIKDMGTPERLEKVERDIEFGLPERLSTRNLRSAVFLDRDGTINCDVNHLSSPEQIELLPGAAEAICRINRAGYLAIVVTNQPVLARGDVTLAELENIHARLESSLGSRRAYLDGTYVCPHHPDRGFEGEVSELKCECACRKPLPGLIEQASKDLHIARTQSWMIGDTSSDMLAGKRAELRTVLVRTGYAGRDDKFPLCADYVVPDLSAAVGWIFDGHRAVCEQLQPALGSISSKTRLILVGGQARAGKSFVAQVLKELLSALGQTAHVISLDAWLKQTTEREEGQGVNSRYDMSRANSELLAIAKSQKRVVFIQPVYDRITRGFLDKKLFHSIGKRDVLIVEGVTALLSEELRTVAQLKLFIEVNEPIRQKRIKMDYLWRGTSTADLEYLLNSRMQDEVEIITKYKQTSDFVINSGD